MNKRIEEMAKEICCYGVDCSECFMKKQDGHCPQLSVADRLYNAGYRKQEWVSVDERLPERNGRYLVHCDLKIDNLVCILCYNKVDGFDETVTHWMPLPEAPKMKGGAE